jgi:hypothetical protein
MLLLLLPTLLGSHLLVAATGALPDIDMQRICRESADAFYASRSTTNDFDNCMSGEQAAREQLLRDWGAFPAMAKGRCVLPREYVPSYIEWLTCLEMEGDASKIRQEQSEQQPEQEAAPIPASSPAARRSLHNAAKTKP